MTNLKPLLNSISTTYRNDNATFGGAIPAGTPLQSIEPNRKDARSYALTSGQNVMINPRSEISGLTPFEILNFMAKSTDLIQIAENILLNQISGRKWDIVVADPEDKGDYKEEIKKAKKFFAHPDKERTYSQWIRKALKNITRYDAFTIYKRRNKKGELYGLTIVDGSTIKIITDSNGNKPIPPEKAYQQIIQGGVRGSWDLNDMIYAPMSEELAGNYGVGPVERILVSTMKYLKKQQFDYSFFKEGAYPDGDLYALKPNDQSQWAADDILKFQENWNTEMSDYKNRQSLKFVPDGQLQKTKEHHWDTIQEEWFGKLVCNSMGIPPQTFSKQVNRAVAETDDRQQTELGLAPYIRHIEDINTDIIQNDLGYEFLAFKMTDEKLEDVTARVEKNVKYIMAGVYNRNEVRQEEGKSAVEGGNEYTVQVGNALIPVEKIGKMITVGPDTGNGEVVSKDITQDNTFHTGTSDKQPKGALVDKKAKTEKVDQSKEVKKAMGQYKKFLVKRFKENGSLLGYTNNVLSPDLIKSVENELTTITTLEGIINIFKAEDDDVKKITSNFKDNISKTFKNITPEFLAYYEEFYKVGNIDAISKFNFMVGAELRNSTSSSILQLREAGMTAGLNTLKSLTTKPIEVTLRFGEHSAVEKALQYTDKLVTGVNQATINFVQQTVSDAIRNEKSWEWIKEQLMDNDYYAFSDRRAETIAKTEEARALNDGGLEVWKETGLVDMVNVIDGDGCLVCAAVDGTTVDIDWAMEHSLEHPNCVREFYPVINNNKLVDESINVE